MYCVTKNFNENMLPIDDSMAREAARYFSDNRLYRRLRQVFDESKVI